MTFADILGSFGRYVRLFCGYILGLRVIWHSCLAMQCNILPRDMQRATIFALQYGATCCNTLQYAATQLLAISNAPPIFTQHCSTLQHDTTRRKMLQHNYWRYSAATRCNTLQHTATRCNTLQHSCVGNVQRAAKIRTILQHTATRCNTLQHAATRCNTLQNRYQRYPMHHRYSHDTATRRNMLQHTATQLPAISNAPPIFIFERRSAHSSNDLKTLQIKSTTKMRTPILDLCTHRVHSCPLIKKKYIYIYLSSARTSTY